MGRSAGVEDILWCASSSGGCDRSTGEKWSIDQSARTMRWHCVLLLLQFISAVQCYVYSSVRISRTARTRRSALYCKHEPAERSYLVNPIDVPAILEPASAAAPTATAPASGSAAASVADVQGRRGAPRESLPLRLDGEWYDLDAWRPLIASDCL